MIRSTNRTIEDSYKVAEDIAKMENHLLMGCLQRSPFLNCAEVLFDDLPHQCTIISRIKDMPISPRTVERRITNMSTDVSEQPTVALKRANVFNVALHESIDINDNPRLAIEARYCSNGGVHEELCCLKPFLRH